MKISLVRLLDITGEDDNLLPGLKKQISALQSIFNTFQQDLAIVFTIWKKATQLSTRRVNLKQAVGG